MNDKIFVWFKDYTESHFLEELQDECKSQNGVIEVIPYRSNACYYIADFEEYARNVLVYIRNHPTELIASGLVVNTVYDILKAIVKTTWKKVFLSNKKETRTTNDRLEWKLTIILTNNKFFSSNNSSSYIEIENYFGKQNIDQIIEAFSDFSQSEVFKACVGEAQEKKIKVRMGYNEEKKEWEARGYVLDHTSEH